MRTNNYDVLYFITGFVPTPEQRQEAALYGPHVKFRNTIFINDTDNCELCTAVAGDVPLIYGRVYPQAVPIADFYAGKLSPFPMVMGEPETAPVDLSGTVAPPPLPDNPFPVLPPDAAAWNRNA